MKTLHIVKRLVLPSLLVIFLAGCELFGSSDPEPGTVSFEIANRINSTDLVMNEQNYQSSAGHDYSVTLVEYIITNIAIVDKDGAHFTLKDAHYVNQEDPSTHTLPAVEIPAGTYNVIEFTFGVEGNDNVFGTLERTTDYDNMMWPMMMPMGDGQTERYHYMRFEGRYGTDGAFRIHTGPSGGNDYSFKVELPLGGLEINGQDWQIGVSMNLDQWLTEPNEWNFDDFGMIMGNPHAQSLIYNNGHSVFKLGFTDFQ